MWKDEDFCIMPEIPEANETSVVVIPEFLSRYNTKPCLDNVSADVKDYIEHLLEEVHDNDRTIKCLKEQVKHDQEYGKDLRVRNEEFLDLVVELRSEISKLEEEKRQLLNSDGFYDRFMTEKDDMNAEMEDLKEELKLWRVRSKVLDVDNCGLKADIIDLQNDIKQLKMAKQKVVKIMQQERATFKSELEVFTKEVQDIIAENNELRKEKKRLESFCVTSEMKCKDDSVGVKNKELGKAEKIGSLDVTMEIKSNSAKGIKQGNEEGLATDINQHQPIIVEHQEKNEKNDKYIKLSKLSNIQHLILPSIKSIYLPRPPKQLKPENIIGLKRFYGF